MSLRLTLRSGSLAQWATAETAGNGKLRKGEIGVGWIEVAGTITEVVMRIGPSATPTAFSACPVISRSPLTAVGPNVKIPVVDTTSKTNSIITLSGGQFVAVDDDPGEYDSQADGGGGGGVVVPPTETPPAITSVELVRGTPGVAVGATLNLSHDGAVSDMSLRVIATGAPAPTVTARIESGTTITNLVGTLASGTWSFPITLSSTATGLHVITITADSVVQPDAIATRNLTIVRAAAPAPVSIAITSLALKNNATNAVLTTAANASGITLRADVTTDQTATTTTYQWRRGQTSISGATSQTYALVTADNDSNVSCLVTVTRTVSGQTATASASASVAVGTAESGWTQVSAAADSRLIFVDSVDGDDAAASAVNGGKGYYLPSHAAIGADPFNPVGPITAYKTVIAAMKKVRLSGCTGEDANGFPVYGQDWLLSVHLGHPDWLLFRRGRTYDVTLEHPWGTGDFAVYMGTQGKGWRYGGTEMFPSCGMLRGRSASEPAVVGAWGPPSDARPILTTTATPYALTINGGGKHLRYLSLDVSKSLAWSYWSGESNYPDDSGDVLLEDVLARSFGGTGAARFVNGVTIRRSQCIDSFNTGGHVQGMFVSGQFNKVVLEECIFDRNGYKENPNLPQTWTSRVVSSGSPGELAPGTGVQPTRTYFDRNLYASSYDSLVIRGCIFSREGGGGNVQMRVGGVAERNLFVFCAIAVGIGHPQASRTLFKSSLLRSNAVLHDDCFLPPGGWGAGLGLGGLENNVSVADDNVIAHFHRSSNGGGAIVANGNGAYQAEPARKLGRAVVKDNAAYFSQPSNPYGLGVVSGLAEYGVLDADMTGNEVSTGLLNNAGDAPKPASWTFSGNRYHFNSTVPSPFRWGFYGEILQHGTAGDLAGWKAQGYDTDLGAVDTDFAAFKASVGWTAPERDIVSYMQSVDPTYVVNEDVYVDDGASGPKQAQRQKVWQVMATGIPGAYTALPEAQAKLAARRYHAFITFIQRARENRKGAWDPRWTAEAVNNYIRQGFGKAPVSGPYTATYATIASYP